MVAEADESDGSFLNYQPRIAVVTNVEPDHLDHYGSPEKFEQAFVDFAQRIVPGGLLVCCADDPGGRRLAQSARRAGIRVATYGTQPYIDDHCQVSISSAPEGLSSVIVSRGRTETEIDLLVPGHHMALNAVGAWIACCELGFDPTAVGQALASFRGTGRRFELRELQVGARY